MTTPAVDLRALPQIPEDGSVRFELTLAKDLALFEGHFPGDPILPGVAQIVALAEAAARKAFAGLGPGRGLRRVKFMRALRPGDKLVVAVSREAERDEGSARVRFTIESAGAICSRGLLLFGAA